MALTVDQRAVIAEVLALWLGVLVLIRGVVALVQGAGFHEVFLAAVPILFMYAPVALCRWRGVDSYSYPLALPAFRDGRPWWDAFRLNLIIVAIIIIPWLVGYHYWQNLVFGYEYEGIWPSEPVKLIGYHLFFVAIPEEFFYRGYLQTRLDEVFEPRWKIFGAMLGPGWLITCVIFAFGHSIVQFQWWHFAIFFPSLVFGWMRARTGGIVAGALFHAWSNITVSILDTLYGIVPPN
ncbi:MAG: CPBP family intramembrane metalloprotease [Proteobacteria bacterium]|nr:CPBP family intramembrane metalloprotease [Pseudomonadota bacterium]